MFALRPSTMINMDNLGYSGFLKGQFVNLLMSVLDMTKQRASDTLQVRGFLILAIVDIRSLVEVGDAARPRTRVRH